MNRLLEAGVIACLTIAPSYGALISFSAAAATPAGIQATVDAFRTSLGTLNPNVVGSLGTGRREINWDGVPDAQSAPNLLAANFFNVNSPRGAIFSTTGTGFEVSGNAGVSPVRFDNINPTYSSTFQTFSPQRLFTPIGSNIMDVTFFVPGTTTPALTSAFGAIFTDVDLANTTSIQLFDRNGVSMGTFFAPTTNLGLSFLGILDNTGPTISRVRLTLGNAALGASDGAGVDVVAMDDFIFGEPNAAVPEPSSLGLAALGLGLVMVAWRRRRS